MNDFLSDIFSNAGKKIQSWAKVLFFIVAILSALGFFCLMIVSITYSSVGITLAYLVLMFLSPVLSFFIYLIIYGFGKIVENNERELEEKDKNQAQLSHATIAPTPSSAPAVSAPAGESYPAPNAENATVSHGYNCPVCNMAMDSYIPCERCGFVPPAR